MHGPYLGVYTIVVGGGAIGAGDGIWAIADRRGGASEEVVAAAFGIERVILATAAALVTVATMVWAQGWTG